MSTSVNNYNVVAERLPVADDGAAGILRALCLVGAAFDGTDAIDSNPALDVLAKLGVAAALVPGSMIEKAVTRLLYELADAT